MRPGSSSTRTVSRIRRRVGGGVIRRPNPLARPRGGNLHWLRLPLMRAHLLYLALATLYVTWNHPSALGPALLIAGLGFVGELAPSAWRRFYLAEALLLAGGVLSFLWMWELDHAGIIDGGLTLGPEDLEAFQGWIRMVFVAWLLIPSRPGYLRWFAGLSGVELALRSSAGPGELWSLVVLVPAAVVALAWDAHLRVASMRPDDVQVGRGVRSPMLRWNGLLIGLICTAGMVVGAVVVRHHVPNQGRHLGDLPRAPTAGFRFGGINQHMHLGDRNFQDKNPSVAAKLTAEDPLPPDTYYLRALTLPYLDLESQPGHVSWRAATRADHLVPDRPTLHGDRTPRLATVFRRADAQDVVLAPDGTTYVGLDDMIGDTDGNLYRPGLGELNTRYEVDLGALVHPVRSWNRYDQGHYLALPGHLSRRLYRHLPAITLWRELEPADAARAITDFLRSRCGYSLRDLPTPGDTPGGSILAFLFAEDPAQRQGHCQFFATAGVLLLRAAGHPARCVVGYASNEVEDNEVVFRGLNAHAWAEFQLPGSDGPYWQRFDPTPSSHLEQRAADAGGSEEEDPFEEAVADANQNAADREGRWRLLAFWAGGALLLAAAGGLVWWLHRREGGDPLQRRLARQTEALIDLALELGLPVDRHSTLSTITAAIEQRTGLDLEPHRRAHLAARFAGGPLPPPWPGDEIRAAARAPR